jgi:hypothetical protein
MVLNSCVPSTHTEASDASVTLTFTEYGELAGLYVSLATNGGTSCDPFSIILQWNPCLILPRVSNIAFFVYDVDMICMD